MMALRSPGAEVRVNFGVDLDSRPFKYTGPLGPDPNGDLADEEKRQRRIGTNTH